MNEEKPRKLEEGETISNGLSGNIPQIPFRGLDFRGLDCQHCYCGRGSWNGKERNIHFVVCADTECL